MTNVKNYLSFRKGSVVAWLHASIPRGRQQEVADALADCMRDEPYKSKSAIQCDALVEKAERIRERKKK